jgi:hypothetical protein
MSGLIGTAQPDSAQAPTDGTATPPPATPAVPVQASQAEYKHDYDRYVSKATMLIHSPDTTGAIQNLLKGPDPVQRVANATVMIMQRVDTASRQDGTEVQDSVKMYASHAIVLMIIELAEAAGIFKLNDDLALLATSVASQDYIKSEIGAKRINAQQLNAKMQADMRQAPQKFRQEMIRGQQKVVMIARKYRNGAGLGQFPGTQMGAQQPQAPTTPPQQG